MNRVDTFLELTVNQRGSDLHFVAGQQPRIRINGVLQAVRFRELSNEDMQGALNEVMSPEHKARLREELSVDFAYSSPTLGRFRINVYHHVHGLAAAMRVISNKVPTLASLDLPEVIRTQASQANGLVLVTGPTGSGKSTTLAAMIDHVNATRHGHIITLEDPIEYVHDFKSCAVSQREIRVHSPSFADALRDAVREDPDVILVGELRDAEEISLALRAAETGVQIYGTLHTGGATRTIDRIINTFPANRQEQARSMLADSLRMIVSQRLLRTVDGSRRVAALEILVNTKAVKANIRAATSHKLSSVIQTGASAGMRTLDSSLQLLVSQGTVTAAEAAEHAFDRTLFENRMAHAGESA